MYNFDYLRGHVTTAAAAKEHGNKGLNHGMARGGA